MNIRRVAQRSPTAQRGGFVMGLIVGLLVGLALALAVALYVTKAPVPFVNKVQQRTPEQDAAEVERNKNWDPNAPLANKPAAPRPTGTPPPGINPVPPRGASAVAEPARPPRDPAAIRRGASRRRSRSRRSQPSPGSIRLSTSCKRVRSARRRMRRRNAPSWPCWATPPRSPNANSRGA